MQDMFTQQVQEEVRKVNKLDNKAPKSANNGTNSGTQSGGVVIVTGVAKKKVQKQKGELIEQNQDGLEYSSEEEGENLHETAAGIANKQKRELAKVDHATTDYQPFRKKVRKAGKKSKTRREKGKYCADSGETLSVSQTENFAPLMTN